MGAMQTSQRKAIVNRPGKKAPGNNAGGWRAGKTPVRLLEPHTYGEVEAAGWCSALADMDKHQEELRCHMRQVSVDHPAYNWLQETAERMLPMDVSDFAPELLQQQTVFSKEDAVKLEMPGEYEPPTTEWLPRKQQQSVNADFQPRGLHDLVAPAGRRKLDRWIECALQDLVRMKSMGRAAGRQFNEVCVLTQEDMYPEARGVFWDLREADGSGVVPVDFQKPLETHLNLEYMRWQCEQGYLQNYPDQELVSQLMLGVSYKDELDMQIVLLPHLISFADGCKQIQADVEELASQGWYSLHKLLPYVPFRNIPRGSTLKTNGDANQRSRRTKKAGQRQDGATCSASE